MTRPNPSTSIALSGTGTFSGSREAFRRSLASSRGPTAHGPRRVPSTAPRALFAPMILPFMILPTRPGEATQTGAKPGPLPEADAVCRPSWARTLSTRPRFPCLYSLPRRNRPPLDVAPIPPSPPCVAPNDRSPSTPTAAANLQMRARPFRRACPSATPRAGPPPPTWRTSTPNPKGFHPPAQRCLARIPGGEATLGSAPRGVPPNLKGLHHLPSPQPPPRPPSRPRFARSRCRPPCWTAVQRCSCALGSFVPSLFCALLCLLAAMACFPFHRPHRNSTSRPKNPFSDPRLWPPLGFRRPMRALGASGTRHCAAARRPNRGLFIFVPTQRSASSSSSPAQRCATSAVARPGPAESSPSFHLGRRHQRVKAWATPATGGGGSAAGADLGFGCRLSVSG